MSTDLKTTLPKLTAKTFGPRGLWLFDLKKRDRASTAARRGAMWAVRASHQMTYPEIGALFGYTASHACQAVHRASERMATDDSYRQQAHDVAHGLWLSRGFGDG